MRGGKDARKGAGQMTEKKKADRDKIFKGAKSWDSA